jgi:succinoglycan biosynthesis protein ExoA
MVRIGRISVVIPMLNEAANVERVVRDLAAQDFQGELEILVADGGSTDGSVARLRNAADRAGLELTVLDNPERFVAHGLNRCLEHATGDLIVRLDCKAHYPPEYLRRSAVASEETEAWAVGGVLDTDARTPTERAVACAMASPFGGLGWTRHPVGERRVEVDHVYCGAFRPEAFQRVGLFDPAMIENHDEEFTIRLRQAGGRVVSDPGIRAFYTPPGSFRRVFGRYFNYGLWKVPVMLKHRRIATTRSLAPIAFVSTVSLLAPAAAAGSPRARRLLATELGAYAGAALVFGAMSIRTRRERWTLLPRVGAVFPTFHVAYGVGMITGWRRAALRRPSRDRSGGS